MFQAQDMDGYTSSLQHPQTTCKAQPLSSSTGNRSAIHRPKAHHSPVSNTQVKNEWSYTSILPCFHCVQSDDFTFTFTFTWTFSKI